jgi:hypothetical protein
MTSSIVRRFMAIEAASFAIAALIHSGLLISGYQHRAARNAESVIAAVLLAALAGTWARPASTRAFGLAGQGFALLGTTVGLFTVAIGIGPRTVLDVVYHISIYLVLLWGLFVTLRWRA